MENIVEIRDLVKIYKPKDEKKKVIANDGLTFLVKEGECLGILGPNGCGKTTLVRQLIGFLPKTSGEIKIFGTVYEKNGREIRKRLGYMMQNRYSHWDHLSVQQALLFTGQLKKMSPIDIKEETEYLINKFTLNQYKNSMIRYLSGGNKQAVSLAITFMGKPKLIILDEPSSGLDPIKRMQLWDLLVDINNENKSSILIVSHNPIEIEKVANKVLILDKGKIIEQGSLKDIKDKLIGEVRIEITLFNNNNIDVFSTYLKEFLPIHEDRRIIFHSKRKKLPMILEKLTQLEEWKNIEDFEIINPSLEDIYIKAIGSKME